MVAEAEVATATLHAHLPSEEALVLAQLVACARPGCSGCAFLRAAAEGSPGDAVHRAVAAHERAVRHWVADLARPPVPPTRPAWRRC